MRFYLSAAAANPPILRPIALLAVVCRGPEALLRQRQCGVRQRLIWPDDSRAPHVGQHLYIVQFFARIEVPDTADQRAAGQVNYGNPHMQLLARQRNIA